MIYFPTMRSIRLRASQQFSKQRNFGQTRKGAIIGFFFSFSIFLYSESKFQPNFLAIGMLSTKGLNQNIT